jgi:tripartite-type tricarboxylate transporter receptor subunit TctC
MQKRIVGVNLILFAIILVGVISASPQENFYQGKTIRMIVATSAGGGFDTYTRTIARPFGKHVPGQPAIVVENMLGARRETQEHFESQLILRRQ